MTANVEVIIGTYEEFLLGYKVDFKDGAQVLSQSFADKSHSGALKCVAVMGRWVATGATDDRIFIYDMKIRKQSQIILTHEGTINALAFTPDETHLLSGGDDGRMLATRLNTWYTEANWKKAHSGAAVTHISCHPSGKLALSLGADLVLRTWNLVKGRVAYKTNLKSRNTLGTQPDCLAWSTAGDYFTLSGQRVVEIWSIKTAEVVRSHKTASKPVCVCWISNEECLVGQEDGKILRIAVEAKDDESTVFEAHTARVKTMCQQNGVLATASSAGEVKLWQISDTSKKLKQIAVTNIGCRPTCIALLNLEQFGAAYNTTPITEQTEQKVKNECKPKQQARGVVTIEYDDEQDASNAISDDDDSNDEAQVTAAQENQLAETTESEAETNSGDDDDSDDEIDNEPQIRLPKSQKRKQQIISKQKEQKIAKLQKGAKKQSGTKQNMKKQKT